MQGAERWFLRVRIQGRMVNEWEKRGVREERSRLPFHRRNDNDRECDELRNTSGGNLGCFVGDFFNEKLRFM